MSFLNDFEGRIGSVFGAAPQGYTEPFSFKKLAKRAAKEMENETYEIDGVDTAPALYTVLVSASDDSLMRPLYEQITYETAAFVTAQAQKKGYSFVGEPLVRFMVDPSLRSGKFSVFAENIDSRTLARLRDEEKAFLDASSSMGGAAAQVQNRAAAPAASHGSRRGTAREPQSPMPTMKPVRDGLDVIPFDYNSDIPTPVASAGESTPMPVAPAPLVAPAAAASAIPVPMTMRRNVPLVDPHRGVGVADVPAVPVSTPAIAEQAPVPVQQPAKPQPTPIADPYSVGLGAEQNARMAMASVSCLLIDRQTGRTFTGSAPSTIIGRERSQAGIVLRDPNVSRTHAELRYDGTYWHIIDLNSTNGTLVNDVDVDECVLRDGDLITIGLMNLEFRENR